MDNEHIYLMILLRLIKTSKEEINEIFYTHLLPSLKRLQNIVSYEI